MVQTYMCTVNCVETARLAMSNFLPAFPYKCRSSETFLGQLLLYSAGKFKCLLEGNPIDHGHGPTDGPHTIDIIFSM